MTPIPYHPADACCIAPVRFTATTKAGASASALLTTALLLGGCASGPPQPDWQINAFAALNSYTSAYLAGNTRVAESELRRARAEIASTGRLDLMARLELVRCAAQVASLEPDACADFQKLAADALPAEQAYAQFLAGRWVGLQTELLPVHYRGLVAQSLTSTQPGNVLDPIQHPLSRLIAAGSLFKAELLTPAGIGLAAETASSQGWRRPLLAWLGVQHRQAQAAGDSTTAASLQRRIDLVLQTPVR